MRVERRDRWLTRAAIRAGAAILALALVHGAAAFDAAGTAAPGDDPESEGRLLVLNKRDNNLMVFDVPSYRLLATVAVGEEPHEVAATPDGRKAYVANARGRSISVVDLRGYKVARTIRSESLSSPHGLQVTPDGRHLLVTSEGSGRLFLIDTARDVIQRSVTTSQKRAHMVTILKGGRRAYVANVASDSLTVLTLPDLRIVKNFKVGQGPEGIAASANGRWIVTALQETDQVAIVDVAGNEVVARLPTGRTPIRVAITPNSFTALIANRASDDVSVIDLLGRRVKTTVGVGRRPGGLVTDARGSRAYVCNNGSNTVSVVSISGSQVMDQIPVGAEPDGIAFVPRGRP
jgi:YVTN family beta-propeller protein